jgi:hypothetical protein
MGIFGEMAIFYAVLRRVRYWAQYKRAGFVYHGQYLSESI